MTGPLRESFYLPGAQRSTDCKLLPMPEHMAATPELLFAKRRIAYEIAAKRDKHIMATTAVPYIGEREVDGADMNKRIAGAIRNQEKRIFQFDLICMNDQNAEMPDES